ncbi:MAG: hypothetical protein OEX04_08450 [Acidimicrobiia bacterium]|nr:hypothetical protein [Acidimicrobiia bacterium]MDH4307498.1 hypothetical protein [Acidimicrobiia bacterium]MDH5293912.1 hypothetical protein [Acidimicrobiia bacterium]
MTFSEAPELALVKLLIGGPDYLGDGRYELTYRITVSNTGDAVLASVESRTTSPPPSLA